MQRGWCAQRPPSPSPVPPVKNPCLFACVDLKQGPQHPVLLLSQGPECWCGARTGGWHCFPLPSQPSSAVCRTGRLFWQGAHLYLCSQRLRTCTLSPPLTWDAVAVGGSRSWQQSWGTSVASGCLCLSVSPHPCMRVPLCPRSWGGARYLINMPKTEVQASPAPMFPGQPTPGFPLSVRAANTGLRRPGSDQVAVPAALGGRGGQHSGWRSSSHAASGLTELSWLHRQCFRGRGPTLSAAGRGLGEGLALPGPFGDLGGSAHTPLSHVDMVLGAVLPVCNPVHM